MQYAQNFIYTLIAILLEFVTSLVLLILINSLVVRQIRNLKRKRKELSEYTCSNNELNNTEIFTISVPHDTDMTKSTSCRRHQRYSSHTTTNMSLQTMPVKISRNRHKHENLNEQCEEISREISTQHSRHVHHVSHWIKGHKAAKSLGLLVFVFVLTWAPYTFLTLVISLCDNCISKPIYEAFIWFLWFKSAVNPFLYAWRSKRFRDNFKHFLCCGRSKWNIRHVWSIDLFSMNLSMIW